MVIRFVKNHLFLFLIILLSLPTILALLHPGFFISDDGEWMIIRLSAFYETLRSGEIPVRFISRLNNGYGYPLGNFMYPGFLYLGSLIHLMGFGFIATIKIIFGVSMVLSGVFTYLWLKKLYSEIPAFFGGLLYVYMPYHLFDMYVRGSIGEMLALCIVPFIFWQIERKDLVFTSFGIGLLVLSHNSLAFLFLLPLYIYMVLRSKGIFWKKIGVSAVPFILGAFLSIFFWLPALYDLQYTVFRSVTISEWEKYFADVGLIGISTIVVVVAALIHLLLKRNKQSAGVPIFYFFIIISILSLFIALPYSSLVWEIFPSSLLQFPFRVLSVLLPAISYIAAFLLDIQPRNKQIILGVLLTIFAVVSSYPYLFPKEVTQKDDMYYISNFSTTTVKDEYMPIWVRQPLPPLAEKKVEIIKGEGNLSEEVQKGNTISFKTIMESEGVVQINSIYFPGWKALVNNQDHTIIHTNPHGLMRLVLLPGEYKVSVKFTETPIRLLADCISLLTLGILVVIFFKKVRYNALLGIYHEKK